MKFKFCSILKSLNIFFFLSGSWISYLEKKERKSYYVKSSHVLHMLLTSLHIKQNPLIWKGKPSKHANALTNSLLCTEPVRI